MINYTRRNVNNISLIITILICICIPFHYLETKSLEGILNLYTIFKQKDKVHIQITKPPENEVGVINMSEEKQTEIKSIVQEEQKKEEEKWEIRIDRIGLVAPIAEGTTKEVMNEFVGHFEITAKWEGNVGLGAHNRGYDVNYFAKVKDLKKGDYIEYTYQNRMRKYVIIIIAIIKDTDWNYLQETEDNRITLITCVENEPNYRRCIQAIEVEE